MMDMPLPEPNAYQYLFESYYGPVWRNDSRDWNGSKPIKTRTLHSADQLRTRDAKWRAIVAAEVAKERERIRAAIMAKHEAANGQHNLYHCLAVELFGDEAIRAAAPPQCTSAPSEPQ